MITITIDLFRRGKQVDEMKAWARNHFGPDKWDSKKEIGSWTWYRNSNIGKIHFEFDNEQDASWFALRWG